jgi:diguanylate cyclase (GGDEF)-like protein
MESHGQLLYRLRRKDGEYIWVETYSRYVHAMRAGGKQILCISRAVGEPADGMAGAVAENWSSEQSNTILDALALRDDLTGLMNGVAIVDMLAGRLASRRSSTFPFGCLLVGVDNFTRVNEDYGHSIGDDTLRRISRLLVECCRTEDYVARLRGDEFIVVLPGTDSAGTIVVAERLIYTIRNAYWPELAPDYKLTISVGGTCVTRTTDMDVSEFLDLLGSQMQQAKELGRSRLVMDARNIARHWLR